MRWLLVIRHLPIESLHPDAIHAAAGAACAGRQNRFWQMHNKLFEVTGPLNDRHVRDLALELSLDPKAFDACVSLEGQAVARADIASAESLSISGTPTFLIGKLVEPNRLEVTAVLEGAEPFAAFARVLDPLLSDEWR